MGLTMRFLVVDDVPAVRMFLRSVLSSFRAEIDEAADGLRAVQLLTQSQYDLAFLDLNLPLLDGMKVLSTVRAESPRHQTPVIVISTVSDPGTLARASALGAVHVMPKPIDASRLLDAAREVLGLPTPPQHERRTSPRLHLSVEIRFDDAVGVVEASTLDMSVSGAFIVTERMRPLGSRGKTVFRVPHLETSFEAEFEVVHLRTVRIGDLPMGMGIRFVDLSPEERTRLLKVLGSRA
jgi:two-component system chemotaxis response regulator CheY